MTAIDGIININKPAGWTSMDVCAKLRSRLHIKKTGHTGTLDPMATGVLPVCVGKATRIIRYYDMDSKSYHAVMKLGVTTDTLDITGEVLETCPYTDIDEKSVREAFKAYTGRISQIPPKYSALKINGRRAYDLAREGADFEMKSREIMIYDNSITRIDLANGEIEFDVSCSKGTYIRTICDDIGRALGCGAVMTALTRTRSGCFRIEDAVGIEELTALGDSEILEKVIPLRIPAENEADGAKKDSSGERLPIISAADTLENLGKVILNDNRVIAFMNGNSTWSRGFRVTLPSDFDELYRVYSGKAFLGVASIENGSLIPAMVLR